MAKAPKSSGAGDTALVKALADILDEAGLAELEYETADLSVRLSRVSGAAPVPPSPPSIAIKSGPSWRALIRAASSCQKSSAPTADLIPTGRPVRAAIRSMKSISPSTVEKAL